MGKLLKANELRREVALNFSIQNVPDKRLTVLSIARQADFFENRKKSTFKTQTSPNQPIQQNHRQPEQNPLLKEIRKIWKTDN